ncbi:MAG: hypothetical protein ACFCUQ_15585 [Kiloniellales bacterium]
MTQLAIHFVDPSIPGLSGRDLPLRLVEQAQYAWAACRGAGNALCEARRELCVRRALADLDRNQLRDIGVDRDAM